MVEKLLELNKLKVNFEALERADVPFPFVKTESLLSSQGGSAFQKEYFGYTPLMLAAAGGDSNVDIVKALLNAKADFKKTDEFGNSILHIAAINSNNKIMDFIAKEGKIDIFGRNKDGETALSICQSNKNQKGVNLYEGYEKDE